MTRRIFLAGLVGGMVMFIWTSAAHMALPLGEAGIQEIPNEKAVLGAMTAGIGEKSGLYLFPGMGLGPEATKAQKEQAMKDYGKRIAVNPSGLLMYFPTNGRPLMMGRWLTVEFLTELAEALLAVFLLSCTNIQSFGGRWGFVFVVGIIASIATNISYWNWYGFPAVYTAAYITIQLVGFAFVGLVAALFWRGKTLSTS